MLGEREKYPLPGRLFRHGTNFDFMFSFSAEKPSDKEWKAFVEMLENEVLYSRQLEEMLHGYIIQVCRTNYMLQKKLELKEM